ncbi:phage terminase large subunit [Pseudoroseomonas cervicalis]|uniref:phage terminase large subunit n=1 Tax=Teichococcus cervicalis TaxID=204525 RepID=UPI0035EDC628
MLAADHLLATKMVGTVRRIVERHPLCRAILPEVPEAWAVDRFTVRRALALRDPSMLAAGLAGNITGARADVIICDDVEVAGNCDTAGKRAELRERLAETEFILTPGGTLLYVGTPHCAESLYRTPEEGEPTLAGYRRLVVPLLNAAGRSAWPQRFPAEDVARLRERVGPIQFSRQMLLRPVAGAAARLDPGLLIRYRDELDYREAHGRPVLGLMGRRMVSGGGYWDPAYGRPGRGDGSVLAITYADGEGNHYLHRLHYLTHDPDQADDPATQQCRQGGGAGAGVLAAGAAGRDQRHRPLPARFAAAGDGARRRALRGGRAAQPHAEAAAHPGRAGPAAGGTPPARAGAGVPHAFPGGDGGMEARHRRHAGRRAGRAGRLPGGRAGAPARCPRARPRAGLARRPVTGQGWRRVAMFSFCLHLPPCPG